MRADSDYNFSSFISRLSHFNPHGLGWCLSACSPYTNAHAIRTKIFGLVVHLLMPIYLNYANLHVEIKLSIRAKTATYNFNLDNNIERPTASLSECCKLKSAYNVYTLAVTSIDEAPVVASVVHTIYPIIKHKKRKSYCSNISFVGEHIRNALMKSIVS